jgi:hypothetical protein
MRINYLNKSESQKLIRLLFPLFVDEDGYCECQTCYKNNKVHWTKARGHYLKPRNHEGYGDKTIGYFIAKYGNNRGIND